MRQLIFILSIIAPLGLLGQKEVKLKKKFFGAYKGEIPAYKLDIGDEVVDVSSTSIFVDLQEDDITISIGNNVLKGKYEVMFEAKSYYLLDVDVENQLANERIMVYKRGKKIARDGMYPQPLAEMSKN